MRTFFRKVTLPSRVPQCYSTIPRPYPRFTSYVYTRQYHLWLPLGIPFGLMWELIGSTYRRVVTITDLMENVLLYRIKPNACPKCEVQTEDLGIPSVRYRARDYIRYDRYQRESETHRTEIEHCRDELETLGIKIGKNLFHGLPRVSPPDLHKPDVLYTVYLRLFKHMIDWIAGFLKKGV